MVGKKTRLASMMIEYIATTERGKRKINVAVALAYPSMFIVFILTINLLCNALGHAGYANAKYW
jgi:hypothetical protein